MQKWKQDSEPLGTVDGRAIDTSNFTENTLPGAAPEQAGPLETQTFASTHMPGDQSNQLKSRSLPQKKSRTPSKRMRSTFSSTRATWEKGQLT